MLPATLGKSLWSRVPKWSNDQWLFCLPICHRPLCGVDDILEVDPCACRAVNQEGCKENIYIVAIINR